jgi:large subunit ribosomal protein L30
MSVGKDRAASLRGEDPKRPEAAPAASRAEGIRVTQVKSGQHAKPKTRGTLRALGLGRIGKTNTLPDRKEIRGMIARVPHLVKVEETEPTGRAASSRGEQPAEGRTESSDESS